VGEFPILPGAPPEPGGGIDTSLLLAIMLEVVAFLNALVSALVQTFNQLGDFLNTFLDINTKALTNIWKALTTLGKDILTLHLGKLVHDLRDDIDRIRKWVTKLHDWLVKLQRMQRAQQLAALRRIVNLIQRVRQILLPFRLLHLKFAQKLDGWLAGIEGKIITRELAIAAKTNEILGWMNVILDPLGFWRFTHASRSLGQFADSLFRIFTGRGFDYWYRRSRPGLLTSANTVPIAQHYAALSADLAAGTGDVPAWRADFAAQLAVWKAQT